MRLLHTKNLTLVSFVTDIPPYAILSHTWGLNEVLFKDIGDPAARVKKSGWGKVASCCQRAAEDGWDYVWIDTCCIDKSDPTELSEAINSMFRWYEKAEICYAYLSDVPDPQAPVKDKSMRYPWKWYFRSSRWFTRGWTLQELLAPTFLLFISDSWGTIGSREEWSSEIGAATKIETKQMLDFKTCCIATKLSWAATRETAREEDRAYSLLGLLGVNMPLIYGEGKNAFIRLQHELIRLYNDETIFAWGRKRNFLAPSPESFADSNGLTIQQFDLGRRGFALTNAGLSLNAEIFEFKVPYEDTDPRYAIQLNCAWAWPPPQTAKSAMLLFLAKDPGKPLHEDALVFFQRTGEHHMHWGEMSSSQKKSLGRHDILITRLEEIQDPASMPGFQVTPRCGPGIRMGFIYRFSKSKGGERTWIQVGQTNQRVYHALKFTVNQAAVWESRVEEDDGTIVEQFSILLKWTTHGLSIGVLKRSSLSPDDLKRVRSLLDSESARPYSPSATFSSDRCLRALVLPKPNEGSAEKRSVFLDLSVNIKQAENTNIPLQLYKNAKHEGQEETEGEWGEDKEEEAERETNQDEKSRAHKKKKKRPNKAMSGFFMLA
ncbi:HET-domain-containing [Fusarium albosuccineum]|uniref:HET-domain-containing n=1 Tax=Fusarium albosuccineum TaxID=1237068 RepID=A0A8H4KZW6_9HYPO|nr:HET-domain-containing [Fusarium albosuccineum]